MSRSFYTCFRGNLLSRGAILPPSWRLVYGVCADVFFYLARERSVFLRSAAAGRRVDSWEPAGSPGASLCSNLLRGSVVLARKILKFIVWVYRGLYTYFFEVEVIYLLSVCLYFSFREFLLSRMLIPSAGELQDVTLYRFIAAIVSDDPIIE